MARSRKKSGETRIGEYLTLMFVLESALNGFMRWAYDAGEEFDADFYRSLNLKHGEQAKQDSGVIKPVLGNLEKYLKSSPDKKADAKAGRSSEQRRREDLHYAVKGLLDQRNSIMHGSRPSLPLERTTHDPGLIHRTAVTFYLVREWIMGWKPGIGRSDLFEGWRYLWLTERDLQDILERGEIESRKIDIDGNAVTFFRRPLFGDYDTSTREFRASKHDKLEIWVAGSRIENSNATTGEIMRLIELQGRKQWDLGDARIEPLRVTGATPEEFRWIPSNAAPSDGSKAGGAGEHLFNVPVWTFDKRQEDRICLQIRLAGDVKSRAQPNR